MAITKFWILQVDFPFEHWSFPASTTAIIKGMPLRISTNKVIPVNSATVDDAFFVGIADGAADGSSDPAFGDGKIIPIVPKGVFLVQAASATYGIGAGLKFNGGATPLGDVVADGAADTIGWVFDDSGSARVTVKVLIDIPRLLGKLFAVVS